MTAFCRSESISLATLRRWRDEAGAGGVAPGATPSGFLDLGPLTGVGAGAITIEVDLGGGMTLRVRRG
jgi:hypothetical protein